MSDDRRVTIVEVGPRDGLQNEPEPIATAQKLRFITALADAGLRFIEVTSFVSPRAIPQLADAMDVARDVPPRDNVVYSALVPNEKGLDRAIESGLGRVAVFTAASETFTRRNINMTIDESMRVFRPLVKRATQEGMSVRGYLSTAFVCPFEGEVEPRRARDLALALLDMGVDEVAISDTIGAATPNVVRATMETILEEVDATRLALHLHDTYGTALANVCTGLDLGIRTFDASAGGLGGCPYAPGAAGNLATEDLVYLLEHMGFETGVDLKRIFDASCRIADVLGRALPGRNWQRLARAGATGDSG